MINRQTQPKIQKNKLKHNLVVFLLSLICVGSAPIAAELPGVKNIQEQWMKELDFAMEKGNYSEARKIIANVSHIAAAERLKPWAYEYVTPAMWLLGEQLFLANRFDESANWVYAAFLGTRIDTAMCMDSTAVGLEKDIISLFNVPVQRARRDAIIMRNAIDYAINFHKSNINMKMHPAWICSMLPAKNGKNSVTVSRSLWPDRRIYQIKKFQEFTSR